MNDVSTIPIRLAAVLLLNRGEISLREIQSLPFVENDDYALAVANKLAQYFQIEHFERTTDQPKYEIDDMLRLVQSKVRTIESESEFPIGSETIQRPPKNLAKSIRKKFAPLGGVNLELPLR